MRVWEHKDEEGRVCAIEVPSLMGRRWATYLVSQIAGATVVRSPKSFSWFREETFCEFDLDGARYSIEEPFGDNSRYWIGQSPFCWHHSFHKVVQVFRGSGLWFGQARIAA
jgi:hypothetical protein